MSIRLILLMFLMGVAVSVFSGAIGSTSEWGIVVTPCAWCGATNGIEVHHIYPQHLWPDRAHDTNNMICLCRKCHLVVGHRGNFTNAVTNLSRMIEEGKK